MSDASARHTAVRSYDQNVVVIAGAGTGKTSLLIERLLNQLIEQDLGVDEIAAITFTEKAAAEMRDRLDASLSRLLVLAGSGASGEAIDERFEADRAYAYLTTRVSTDALLQRTERLLGQIGRASIATIHAYCAALLRQFPAESGVDPDFAIDEGPRFDALRAELWEQFLSGPDGPNGTESAAWQGVLRQLDPGEVREIGWKLASFELPTARPVPAPARRLLEPIVRDQLLANAATRGSGTPGPESYLVAADRVLRALLDGGLAEFRTVLEGSRFESARGPRGLLETAAPTSRDAPNAARCARRTRRLLALLERTDDELFEDALALLRPFASLVFVEARRRSLLPFEALLLLARDLLAAHPHVRRTLGRRLQLLMVDEFQDTNPLQYEIVFFLAEDPAAPAATRAFDTQLAAGKLFIVGDPKQAIYRFRGADMASYHLAVGHVEQSGGQRLTLNRSFRASPELLEPLDRVFPALLSAPPGAEASAYSGYDSLRSALDRSGGRPRVEVWTVGSDQERSADVARRDEAEAIASWIAEELQAERLVLGDVAILFQALTSVSLYAGALRERGIPYALETGRDLLERPEGQQLVSLLRALANPADAPAVLGVLRSALGGVPDTELVAYAATAPPHAWSYLEAAPDPARFPGVARTYALLSRWHAVSLTRPLDSLLSALTEEAWLLPVHAAAADGAQRLSNLRRWLDPLIELARREPTHTIVSLLPWLDRRDQPIGAPADRSDELRIMTIHASKGLEFPLVFAPDLARSPSAGPAGATTEIHWLRREQSFAVNTPGPLSAGALVREAEEAQHETAEDRRLFYVACTRAAERLILVHAPRNRVAADAPVRHLAPWGYPVEGLRKSGELPDAPDVFHRFPGEAGPARAPEPEPRRADCSGAVARTLRIAERARTAATPAFLHPTGLREQADARLEAVVDTDEAPRRAGSFGVGRGVGTVLHEVLERWDFRNAEAATRLLHGAVARVCRDARIDPKELEGQAAQVLRSLVESDLPSYLSGVEVLGRELPLLFEDAEGRAWSGTIDLLYRETDGRLVVADYKTDQAPAHEIQELYREQLEVYGRGIARAFPRAEPPALELIHLRSGERVRL
jgi:ATP-dependent helicase/nuclease subunit A